MLEPTEGLSPMDEVEELFNSLGKVLANAGTIDFILLRLDPEYPLETAAEVKDPCEVSSLDEVETSLLWGMLRALQMLDDPALNKRTPSSQALRCLSKCLHSVVQDGYVPGAISLMSLVLLALHLFPDLPVVEAGLADDIAILTVASELNMNEEWTKTFLVDRTREAFELKRLLLLSICYLAQQNDAIEILRKRRVIIGLLRMAEPNAIELSQWHHTLSTALADLALHALIAISVTAPLDLVKCGGLSYFLLVVESFTTAQIDTEKLLACFTALYYISCFKDKYFLQEINDTGAICIILRFCHSLLSTPDFQFAQQRVLTKAFIVLKVLCMNNIQEKERHGGIIIKILHLFLKLVLSTNSSEELFPVDDKEQWFQTYSGKVDYNTSPAILDMYASARPKIYAMVKLIKNRYQEITQEIEEFYHAHNVLKKKEEITMELADKYLEMKIKEVWNEITLDLASAFIAPTDSDNSMMMILNDKLLHLTYQIQKQQHKLVQDIKNKELKDEKNLYDLVEGSNAVEESETMKELETVACASDPFYMNAVKELERQQISTIFPINVPLSQCFSSYTSDLLCKIILHQHYNVRCRKDYGLKNTGFVESLDTTESSKSSFLDSKTSSEASQSIGSNSDLF
ncbi:Uncharacterized protein GBIM_09167 [Gryllus bimaculatus]|nr:Uncharacterized protein GBIM_09167 [Gryllus bimaculatus]